MCPKLWLDVGDAAALKFTMVKCPKCGGTLETFVASNDIGQTCINCFAHFDKDNNEMDSSGHPVAKG